MFGAYPADLREAFVRAVLVLAGGSLQTAAILAAWLWRGKPFDAPPDSGAAPVLRPFRAAIWHRLSGETTEGRFAWPVAIVLAVATVIERVSNFPNGYRLPITAAIVVRPDLQDTLRRSFARLAGTLIGAALSGPVAEDIGKYAAFIASPKCSQHESAGEVGVHSKRAEPGQISVT